MLHLAPHNTMYCNILAEKLEKDPSLHISSDDNTDAVQHKVHSYIENINERDFSFSSQRGIPFKSCKPKAICQRKVVTKRCGSRWEWGDICHFHIDK